MDWDLSGFGALHDKLFVALYVIYHAAIYFLWWRKINNTEILKPLKLLAVFLHEFGHGSAAMLTGGRFKGIQVNADETGLAIFSGGWNPVVIPGGYVGGAFWGAAFVALSGNRVGATIAASLLAFALLFSLTINPSKVVVYISIAFSVLTILVMVLDWFVYDPLLQYFTLFYGVFFGYYACRDIWDDCVVRNAEGSDSMRCHDIYNCCKPRCVGIQFLVVSVLFQVVGLYIGLVWMVSSS